MTTARARAGSPGTATTCFSLAAAGRRKASNVERDAQVSLTVHDRVNPLRCLESRGTAAVTEDRGRMPAVALAERYEGPGAGEKYPEPPPEVVRVVGRITRQRLVGAIAD
ncbi:PPOX class F420-dependent oxidoreductase [Streptomyces sp. 900116325]